MARTYSKPGSVTAQQAHKWLHLRSRIDKIRSALEVIERETVPTIGTIGTSSQLRWRLQELLEQLEKLPKP